MQELDDLIPANGVVCQAELHSKKRVLEEIADVLADSHPELDNEELFACLLRRERLGSTGVGRGVAIPHGRINGLENAVGVFLSLEEGVDFDTNDGQPVDLFFGLVVPADCTEQHLRILARVAEMFTDDELCSSLRAAGSAEELRQLVVGYEPAANN